MTGQSEDEDMCASASGKQCLPPPFPACPFCGSSALDVGSNETKEDYPSEWFAFCPDCGAQGPTVCADDDELGALPWVQDKYHVEAVEAWRRRV